MDTAILILLLLVALLVAGAFVYAMMYNRLQKYIVRIKEAESEIDNALRKKYDTLSQMEKVINDTVHLKQNNFANFENDKMSNYEVDRRLTKISDTFRKIKNDYADELDIESFRDLIVELKMSEEKCDSAKTYYNKYTTTLNMIIKKFPSNIVARMHGINERMYFDNKNMNDEDIFDFKI